VEIDGEVGVVVLLDHGLVALDLSLEGVQVGDYERGAGEEDGGCYVHWPGFCGAEVTEELASVFFWGGYCAGAFVRLELSGCWTASYLA